MAGTNPVLGVVIGLIGLAFPLWLIIRAMRTSAALERRLRSNDPTLLDDEKFKIDRVTLGPAGTELTEEVRFVVAPTAPAPPQVPLNEVEQW